MKTSKRNTDYLLLNKNITKLEWFSGLLQNGSESLILSIHLMDIMACGLHQVIVVCLKIYFKSHVTLNLNATATLPRNFT